MEVYYKKYYNEEKKITEYLLVNFDYYDGNELLASIFCEEYGFSISDSFDGIWYTIIHISLGNCIYELLWNEDSGNSIYCLNQADETNELLEKRLKNVIDILNSQISKSH